MPWFRACGLQNSETVNSWGLNCPDGVLVTATPATNTAPGCWEDPPPVGPAPMSSVENPYSIRSISGDGGYAADHARPPLQTHRGPVSWACVTAWESLRVHSACSPGSVCPAFQAAHLPGRADPACLLIPRWVGSTESGPLGTGCHWVLAQRWLQAQVWQIQSIHPPWEVRGNSCVSMVSMETCQPGNLEAQPHLALEAFVFVESLRCVNTKSKPSRHPQRLGLPSWPLEAWPARTPRSRGMFSSNPGLRICCY